MAQNKRKQMARLAKEATPKSSITNPLLRETHTNQGNAPGQRNRIGMRKSGQVPRFKEDKGPR